MFCKVCFDASSSLFNNHNVKDSAGNVVCPTLLNTKCRSCGCFGHTVKYCKNKAVVQDSYKPKKASFDSSVKMTYSNGGKNTKKNIFEFLTDDSSDSEYVDCDDMFANDEIIWGVGFRSMIGKNWADVVGC